MKVTMESHRCIVEREPGDPYFSGNMYAKGESRLLYHVKKILNNQGYDLIKKRMHKDGHLVDEMQQYLRSRVYKLGKPCLAIYNGFWAIRGADVDFRENGKVVLYVTNIGREDENDKSVMGPEQ